MLVCVRFFAIVIEVRLGLLVSSMRDGIDDFFNSERERGREGD